jgi:hypothetical protein
MQPRCLSSVTRLSDARLLQRVVQLAGREREATVELVAHLAELDARKLYRGEGYGSLFAYCTGALHLAEHAAYNRIEAARLSRRFPAVLDLLADGSLNLSTLRLLAPHCRPANFEALVAEAQGRSKREVEALVARLAPRPDVPPSVRKLPTRDQPAQPLPASVPVMTAQREDAGAAEAAATSPDSTTGAVQSFAVTPTVTAPESGMRKPEVVPLSPQRYRVQFTVGQSTHEKLRRAQDLLRREIPDGDPGTIFDRALTLLLEETARKKLAATSKPRAGGVGAGRPRHIPAHVKRTVWRRDGGRCAFVSPRGRRCDERVFLEFHHGQPYALGGGATVENISLRCRAHNAYEAELAFGPGVSLVREKRRSFGTPPPARRARSSARESPGTVRVRTRPGASFHSPLTPRSSPSPRCGTFPPRGRPGRGWPG